MLQRVLTAIVLALAVAATAAAGQAELPAFDVASVKPQEGEAQYVPSSPDRYTNPRATLRSLVGYAWEVRGFQVEGGPDWAGSRAFDVSARAPGAVGAETMRLMMRRLLAERFALRVREETRELPTYALIRARRDGEVAKGLVPAAMDCAAILAARNGAPPMDPASAPCAWRVGITPTTAFMLVDGAPMRDFAGLIEQLVRRRVVDETGIAGAFDIRLNFTTEGLGLPTPPPSPDQPAPARDIPSLFTALEDQLGLKLESRRGPVPIIVIESAELPAAN
jgi:uncharacterized protein (TIGR03435 family)